eukprot:4951437-Pleurochrysis_carterae.AAC.2
MEYGAAVSSDSLVGVDPVGEWRPSSAGKRQDDGLPEARRRSTSIASARAAIAQRAAAPAAAPS